MKYAIRSKKHIYQFCRTMGGFTLMEIVVATAIFAFVMTAMMSLFNYTLKINRRAEALRQATQGMRNFVEFLVKEIRNGKIDYAIENSVIQPQITPCPIPASLSADTYGVAGTVRENRLGIRNLDGDRICIYLADANTSYVGANNITGFMGNKVMLKKGSLPAEDITPPNFQVQELQFFIRPLRDPYIDPPGGLTYVRTQPSVTIAAKFVVTLPTREQVEIYYQTSVSTNKYDIPTN